MPNNTCKSRCEAQEFETPLLLTKQKTKYRGSYTTRHKQAGLLKCTTCEYITALPVKNGTYCKCCRSRLSSSLYNNKFKGLEISYDA